jgi:hypothetical protein
MATIYAAQQNFTQMSVCVKKAARLGFIPVQGLLKEQGESW